MRLARPKTLALLTLFFLLLAAVPGGTQEPRFAETTTVVAVEIPVNVIHDGRPVRGLTAGNFEVLEGRKRLKITGFEVIDLASEAAPEATPQTVPAAAPAAVPRPLSAQARRHFLLLFDLSFSDPSGVVRAREAARDLVLEGLHPSDLVAVATYASSRGVDWVLGFTPDRRQIAAAIDGLGLVEPLERVSDPLRIMVTRTELETLRPLPETPTGVPDAALMGRLESFRDASAQLARVNREVVKNQVLALTGSLAEMAEAMNRVQGRKQVVFLSEGFDSSVLLGTEDAMEIQRQAETAARGEYWRVDSDARFGSGAAQSALAEVVGAFQRCDCAVQAVDIGGVRAGAVASEAGAPARLPDIQISALPAGENGLFALADQTGGELYRNYNDLSDAMDSLLERTSVTYLLVLEPQALESDGEFHPIKVRLKNVPKGARAFHRAGYFAPQPYLSLAPDQRRLQTAELISAGVDGGEISTSVLAAPFADPTGRAQVLTLVEIVGPTLIGMYGGQRLPVEIYAYAVDRQGSVHDFFTQAVNLDLLKVGPLLRYAGFKFLGHLDLAPGEYEVRVLVRNALTGTVGLRTAAVRVPAFEGEATLLPPLFIEPEGSWVLGWEKRPAGEQRDYPLVVRDKRLVPATRPVLPAGRESPVLLVAHNLGSGAVSAAGRLLDASGGVKAEIPVALEDRWASAVRGAERIWGKVAIGQLDPGSYHLNVTVTHEGSGRSVESSIPVVIQ